MSIPKISERKLIALIAAIQFVNILDFMIVMPLGPDFSRSLGIPTSHLGWIGGAYTFAACISGIIGSFFLDRLERKKGLLLFLTGLSLATLGGALAQGLGSLMFFRVLAGLCGGPATTLSLSIIADSIPPERRGRAMGAVMSSFSLASIFGVPAGLELARLGGWWTPFLAVGALSLAVTLLCVFQLPSFQHVKDQQSSHPKSRGIALNLKNTLTLTLSFLGMGGAFLMIPNFSAYFIYNLAFPREHLGKLYFIGGIVSLICMRIAGKMIDLRGVLPVMVTGVTLFCFFTLTGYTVYPPLIAPPFIFVGIMTGMSIRNVCIGSLSSRVPLPHERAGFLSVQSAIQHLASSLGAFSSSIMLSEVPETGALIHFDQVTSISMALALMLPILVFKIERHVRAQEAHTI